ncbi:MAG: hypothetical protein SGARI_007872, partial [Bacillariaceae sp.]
PLGWVTIQNLQSETGKTMNGKLGKVLTSKPNENGRHQVQVGGSSDVKLLKEANLVEVPKSDLVQVLRVSCCGEKEGGEESLESFVFPKQHYMFQGRPQGICPFAALCGFPLLIKTTVPSFKLSEPAAFDNPMASRMMMDPNNGNIDTELVAPGPVHIVRPNGDSYMTTYDL